jgi:uncharacterized protein with HEPN domain
MYTKAGRAAFAGSPMAQDAVMWNVHRICYAARKVSEQEQALHPGIEWSRLRSLRKGLVDEDLAVDEHAAWDTLERELPALKHQLRMLLTERI